MKIEEILQSYANREVLSSMHNLRWDVFINRLNWKDGLLAVNYMEIDNFDYGDCVYLGHKNQDNKITASVRLIPTNKPYMIKQSYPQFVFDSNCPDSNNIYEISRFCFLASDASMSSSPAAYLAAACIEYGLQHNIQKFIALTNLSVKRMIERVGWDPTPIGAPQKTPDSVTSIVCEYSVNEEILSHIKQKNGIEYDVLVPTNTNQKLLSLYNENKASNDHSTENDLFFKNYIYEKSKYKTCNQCH